MINKFHPIIFLLARINLPNYFITYPDTFLYIYVMDQELELYQAGIKITLLNFPIGNKVTCVTWLIPKSWLLVDGAVLCRWQMASDWAPDDMWWSLVRLQQPQPRPFSTCTRFYGFDDVIADEIVVVNEGAVAGSS